MNGLVRVGWKKEAKKKYSLASLSFVYKLFLSSFSSFVSKLLAYGWARKQEDYSLHTLLKSFDNWLLAYFPPLYVLRFLQRLCSEEPWYPIEYEIILTTTRVIFTRSMRTGQPICLKLWQRSEDEVCNDKLVKRDEDYLLDGLAFNRKFAQFEGPRLNRWFIKNVYLGIAPVTLSKDTKKIRRGKLIAMPEKSQLKSGAQYVLVMRCLNRHWHLDYQLGQRKSGKEVNIDFLAKEIARMHRRLENSPEKYGTSSGILAKLKLNSELFLEALPILANGHDNLKKYGWITEIMAQACGAYEDLFRRRYQNGQIKRCHGDLKATNLWISPAKTLFFGLKKYPKQLLALDCIDFNPEFCNIDTLSDVAMLAIDIEMHSMIKRHIAENTDFGQGLANYFLDNYLRDYGQDVDAWPLLQYYMTEKAMVCAYVSILYDGLPALGEKYLHIASVHAMQLPIFIDTAVETPAFVVSQSR
jgi:aminoglycoside phosphotransferase family enzyme